MNHLPPGRARQRYIESLRAQAESNWALIEGRLEDEEGEEEERGRRGEGKTGRRGDRETREQGEEKAEEEKAKDGTRRTEAKREAAATGVGKVDEVKRGRVTRAVKRSGGGPEVQEQ